MVITDLHTLSGESCDTDAMSEEADGDSDSSFDPLDDVSSDNETPRRRLFNDTFGDVGLAASIFQILGTPTSDTWPVSPHAHSWSNDSNVAGIQDASRCREDRV